MKIKFSPLPARSSLYGMTEQQLIDEYVWCEQVVEAELDHFDTWRLVGRRAVIERLLERMRTR